MNWRFVDRQVLVMLHEESLAEHGGAPGLRDQGLFESALARPLNLAQYGEPDAAALAASYGVGLAKNHAFVDGNKRVASPCWPWLPASWAKRPLPPGCAATSCRAELRRQARRRTRAALSSRPGRQFTQASPREPSRAKPAPMVLALRGARITL